MCFGWLQNLFGGGGQSSLSKQFTDQVAPTSDMPGAGASPAQGPAPHPLTAPNTYDAPIGPPMAPPVPMPPPRPADLGAGGGGPMAPAMTMSPLGPLPGLDTAQGWATSARDAVRDSGFAISPLGPLPRLGGEGGVQMIGEDAPVRQIGGAIADAGRGAWDAVTGSGLGSGLMDRGREALSGARDFVTNTGARAQEAFANADRGPGIANSPAANFLRERAPGLTTVIDPRAAAPEEIPQYGQESAGPQRATALPPLPPRAEGPGVLQRGAEGMMQIPQAVQHFGGSMAPALPAGPLPEPEGRMPTSSRAALGPGMAAEMDGPLPVRMARDRASTPAAEMAPPNFQGDRRQAEGLARLRDRYEQGLMSREEYERAAARLRR